MLKVLLVSSGALAARSWTSTAPLARTPCPRTFASKASADTQTTTTTTLNSDADRHEYADAELELKRNKSGLKPWTRRRMHCDWVETLDNAVFDFQTTVKARRRLYAKHGRASGIDPSILWPSADELRKAIDMERELEPDLGEMLREVDRSKREEAALLRERELKVDQQMAKMDGWMRELQMRKAKKIAEMDAIREKKERLIEEVKEYFGYKLSPRDPKFQEVLDKKEKEERKAAKEAKKTEKMSREIAKLSAMAQQHQQQSTAEVVLAGSTAEDGTTLPSGDNQKNAK